VDSRPLLPAVRADRPDFLTELATDDHCDDMRRIGWGSLVGLLLGCGRSDLSVGDLGGPGSHEPGAAIDAASDTVGDGAAQSPTADGASGKDTTVIKDGSPGEDATMNSDSAGALSSGDEAGQQAGGYFPDARCGPSNCGTGGGGACCREDGFCVTDDSTGAFCGFSGRPCFSCAPNTCAVGYDLTNDSMPVAEFAFCVRMQSSCGPSNCEGCCQGSGGMPGETATCVLRGTINMCGLGGSPCMDCPPNEQCVPVSTGGSFCQLNDPCSPDNCTGCCAGDVCAAGDQDIACGYGGAACQSCADAGAATAISLGGRCIANACQTPLR
jgi:hypothetical protein